MKKKTIEEKLGQAEEIKSNIAWMTTTGQWGDGRNWVQTVQTNMRKNVAEKNIGQFRNEIHSVHRF